MSNDPRRRLAAAIGRDAIAAGPPVTIDGLRSSVVVVPETREAAREALRACGQDGFAVVPVGNGTAQDLGNALERFDVALKTTGLSRIVEYEPRDLVATVEPGVRVIDLLSLLQKSGQTLPIDPAGVETRTIGGLVATNAFGPRRARFGSARDAIIGATVVTPDGKETRAGGRVVKNVSGFDLHKLLCGSLGSLGVAVEISLKLRPLDRARATAIVEAKDAAAAADFVVRLRRGAFIPSALDAWIEEPPAVRLAVRFEESEEAVESQVKALETLGLPVSAVTSDDADIWKRLRDVALPSPDDVVLRVACRPAAAIPLLAALREKAGEGAKVVARPAAGALAVRFPASPEARARIDAVRAALPLGAFAVVECAPAAWKRDGLDALAIPAPVLDVHRRLKAVFDPARCLAPGRLGKGV